MRPSETLDTYSTWVLRAENISRDTCLSTNIQRLDEGQRKGPGGGMNTDSPTLND